MQPLLGLYEEHSSTNLSSTIDFIENPHGATVNAG